MSLSEYLRKNMNTWTISAQTKITRSRYWMDKASWKI